MQNDKDLLISWTLGRKFDGTEVYIPSDIVYYGQKTSRNRIYFGHSSGIAAYDNYKEAEERVLVELIERDALMRNWYSHESPNIIAENILPIHVRKRISYWQKQNRKIMILEMPSKYGWVFEAIVVSNKYPFFVSGAAATIKKVNIPDAINKALQEAEYNLLLCINYPDNSEINPKLVSIPTDHGKVYHTGRYAGMLSWLWSGRKTECFAENAEWNIEDLKKYLDVTTVDLSNPTYKWSVVRVFSPKLLQINFGFYSAHYDRLDLVVNEKSLTMPHYFA
jgi:ribosomal protein S12 methylthiotransferase accessory factor YcaO